MLCPPVLLLATPTYRLLLADHFPDTPVGQPEWFGSSAACNTCHYAGEGPDLNLFGTQFRANEYDFASIEDLDADSDGIANKFEFQLGTSPAVDADRLARYLAGDPTLSAERFPNVNADQQPNGLQIIDAADLIFRYQPEAAPQ